MLEELFPPDYGEGGAEKDDTQITTTILYFSEEEQAEFKQLCKLCMKDLLGLEKAIDKGNISDAVLMLLRKNYASTKA
jgi:hypothetical protein